MDYSTVAVGITSQGAAWVKECESSEESVAHARVPDPHQLQPLQLLTYALKISVHQRPQQ